jgi:hypothetical protein
MPPPGYGGGYAAPQPKRSNLPAIFSLILGILGCVPFVTGLLAIVLGIVGIRKGRNPQVGGKGLAIAGIILGLISVVAWSVFGGTAYGLWKYSKPAREVSSQFAKDLSAGNLDAAQARCTPTIKRADLERAAAKLKSSGQVKDTTLPVFHSQSSGGVTTMDVGGAATFTNNQSLPYFIRLVKQGDEFKIDGFMIGDSVSVGTTPEHKSGSGSSGD